jgi:hypothetical protein
LYWFSILNVSYVHWLYHQYEGIILIKSNTEWLLFNTNFSSISWQERVNFDEMMIMMFTHFCRHFASVIVVHVCRLHIFIFFSETTEQISTKLGRNVPWEVLYQICYFGADRKSNMAAKANNVFWLVETLKIFLSETTQPMEL